MNEMTSEIGSQQPTKQERLLRPKEVYERVGIGGFYTHNLFQTRRKEFHKRSLNKKQGDGVIRCIVPLQHKNNKDGNK